uniref:Sulfatase n=1 Tax=Solibacter usitatus (strain Ellin6076) TaxID=234267 RepID=Q01VH9_SOLUE
MALEHVDTREAASPSQPGKQVAAGRTRHDLAIALSLANLCYLRVWSELLTYRRQDTYLMKAPPGPAEFGAVMVNVLLLALLLWGLVTLARNSLSPSAFRWVQAAFLLFLVMPLNALREVAAHHFPYLKSPLIDLLGPRGVVALAALLGAAGVGAILLFHRKLASLAGIVLAAFLPFCAVTFGQALYKSATYKAGDYANNALAPLLPNARTSPRVVWILFDEWDYRLTFVDPLPGLRFPELERLAAQSLVANHAVAPASETPVSMPAYFTGRLVEHVDYDGPRELQITYQHGPGPIPWSAQPSVFSRARELGFNTALVDWFHPSCRVLTGLASCEWWRMPLQYNSMGDTFWQQVPAQARSLVETTLFSPFGQSLSVRSQIETYHAILASGLAVANNPAYGLSFIHMPVPHAPHAYDRRTGQFTLANSPIRGYFDSLALLNRTLGEIRRSMESAGTWDTTAVILTSDHPYREAGSIDGKNDSRIPYFVKLPSQKGGELYTPTFNTVLSNDLVLAILRREVTDSPQLLGWLNRNSARSLK